MPRNPRLFVTDGLNGMPEAIGLVFPDARHQRCLVHVMRNIVGKARQRDRGSIAEDFRKVYNGVQTAGEAAERLGEFVAKWAGTYPASSPC